MNGYDDGTRTLRYDCRKGGSAAELLRLLRLLRLHAHTLNQLHVKFVSFCCSMAL